MTTTSRPISAHPPHSPAAAPSTSTRPIPQVAPGASSVAPPPPWPHRSLVSLADLTRADLDRVFSLAEQHLPMVMCPGEKSSALAGRSVALLFFEDSTRTRTSFTRAAQLLGADVLPLTGIGSSVSKGETTIDTARNVEAMGVEVLVVRHPSPGAPKLVADRVSCCVINGGDGRHEHPTQGLLDVLTLRRQFGPDLATRRIGIVGDIVNSRVARSAIIALNTLGVRPILVGPPSLAPAGLADAFTVDVRRDLDETLPTLDAIMMLRVQFERLNGRGIGSINEYRTGYALTSDRAARLPHHAIVLHPGPMNRGLEIDSDVADGPRSVIMRQVTHGVAVRMSVLRLLIEARDRHRAGKV